MPGRDATGPKGHGAMTGCRRGDCRGGVFSSTAGRGRGRGHGVGGCVYEGRLSPRAYRHGGVVTEDLHRAGETTPLPELGPAPAGDHDELAVRQATTPLVPVAVVARPDDCVLCGVCVDACPSHAMALGDMVVIDDRSCTACGVCVNICPNDVLEMSER